MLTYELTDQEAAIIDWLRKTPDRINRLAEHARTAGLTRDQRTAEQVVAYQTQAAADLARPEIAVIVAELVDGKVPNVKAVVVEK